MNFIQEMQNTKEAELNKIVDLIIKGIEMQYVRRKIGMDNMEEQFKGVEYLWLGFGCINSNEIQSNVFLKNLSLSVKDNMSEIERRVNLKVGVKAIEYRIDRKNHYLKLII